jgi:hypothetical protein
MATLQKRPRHFMHPQSCKQGHKYGICDGLLSAWADAGIKTCPMCDPVPGTKIVQCPDGTPWYVCEKCYRELV